MLVDTAFHSEFGLTDAGPADPRAVVTDLIYLNVRDPAALAERARSISTPGSPDYGKFMTPGQIEARNRLSPAQFEHVRRWLTSAGLSFTQPNWRELFGHRHDRRAAEGVRRDLRRLHRPGTEHPPPLMAPCSRYWGQKPATGLPEVNDRTPSLAPCGYTPTQLRHAYGLDSETGKGQTVAVIGIALDTLEQDVDTWSQHVGTQQLRDGQLTVLHTPDGTPGDTSAETAPGLVESTMDVEAVHGMAPDADVIVIGYSTSPDNGPNLDMASVIYLLRFTGGS